MRPTKLTLTIGTDVTRELLDIDDPEVKLQLQRNLLKDLAQLLVDKYLPDDLRFAFDAAVEERVTERIGEMQRYRGFAFTNRHILAAIKEAEEEAAKALESRMRAIAPAVVAAITDEGIERRVRFAMQQYVGDKAGAEMRSALHSVVEEEITLFRQRLRSEVQRLFVAIAGGTAGNQEGES